jgi:hypothetical protein
MRIICTQHPVIREAGRWWFEVDPPADGPTLQRLVDAFESKYGPDWRFDVADGGFAHPESSSLSDEARAEVVLVLEVAPSTVFAFGKGDVYSQTRWRFGTD